MKKYASLILVVFLFSCVVISYDFIEESILIGATPIKAKGSGYLSSHWLFTFENGMTIRNFDTGYSLGKVYRIYYSEKFGRYKAALKRGENERDSFKQIL